jgi:hypothetical protein
VPLLIEQNQADKIKAGLIVRKLYEYNEKKETCHAQGFQLKEILRR